MAKTKERLTKKHIALSLLAAAVLPLVVAFFGPFEIYLNNRNEFSFAPGDFLWTALLLALVAFAVLAAALFQLRGRAFLVGLSLICWLTLMAFLQGNFLNFGMDSLAEDGLGGGISPWLAVLDAAIWLAVGAALVTAALKIKDTGLFTGLAAIAIVMVLGVQLLNLGLAALMGQDDGDLSGDAYQSMGAVLTDEGMFDVAEDGNVIVIVLDRFDVLYYDRLVEFDSNFFAPLDGFTYYGNHMARYSRTYPSITYMLTGMAQDFDMSAEQYFKTAYRETSFFSDLKSNGYDIGLYTEYYYAYRNANVLYGIADNLTLFDDYRITDSVGLTANMIGLSAYRYLPIAMKGMIKISSGDFGKFMEYQSEDTDSVPRYVTDDAATYESFREEGITVIPDSKRFTFIHLNGCHNPYNMDENGNRVEDGQSLPAIRGVFKMIYEYLDALKTEGLYEDATIIITGDHARSDTDREDLYKAKVTALFVKPSGSAGTPMAYSDAPVSQDMLRAEIVSSAGIVTETDYGPAFSEIAEDADIERIYHFEKTLDGRSHQIVEYRVMGDANDFSNWRLTYRFDIGYLYE